MNFVACLTFVWIDVEEFQVHLHPWDVPHNYVKSRFPCVFVNCDASLCKCDQLAGAFLAFAVYATFTVLGRLLQHLHHHVTAAVTQTEV